MSEKVRVVGPVSEPSLWKTARKSSKGPKRKWKSNKS